MLRTLAFALLLPALAAAQAPGRIGYQGRLLKGDGNPEAGTLSITFSVFAQSSGSQPALWTETQTVALTDGYYAVVLGDQAAFTPNVFDGGERFLELSIGGAALSPRQRIDSVPYALTCTNLSGGTIDASSISVGGVSVIDSSGKLTSNAFALGSGLSYSSGTLSLVSGCSPGQVLQASASGWVCAANGSVMSVTAAAPLNSSGGANPNLSIPKAGAADDGYLAKADWAAFNAKRSTGGRNLIDWVSDAARWQPGAGTTATVAVDTTDSIEGDSSFTFTVQVGGTGGGLTYGDYIPVEPGRRYRGRISAKMPSSGTGTFSAGFVAYSASKQLLVNGTSGPFLAARVTLTSAWQTFTGAVHGEGTAQNAFPVGTRFIRPFVTVQSGGFGYTTVDGFAIFEDDGPAYRPNCLTLLQDDPKLGSGVYTIDPLGDSHPINVWCDMTTDGGGWTLTMSADNAVAGDSTRWSGGLPIWHTAHADAITVTPTATGKSAAYSTVHGTQILFKTHSEAAGRWASFSMPGSLTMLDLVGTQNISTLPLNGYLATLTKKAVGSAAVACWNLDWRVTWRNFYSADATPDSAIFAPAGTESGRPCGGNANYATGIGARTDSGAGFYFGYGGTFEGYGPEGGGNVAVTGGYIAIYVR